MNKEYLVYFLNPLMSTLMPAARARLLDYYYDFDSDLFAALFSQHCLPPHGVTIILL